MKKSHILLVEDDVKIQRLLHSQLAHHRFEVRSVDNSTDTLKEITDGWPDIVLLDINLNGEDGLDICGEVRKMSSLPIIFLTATDTPQSKIQGLQAGGDDYVTKPFHVGELMARIQAVLRRAGATPAVTPSVLKFDDFEVQVLKHTVTRSGQPIHLTKIEFSLLCELAQNADKILTYEYLLEKFWGSGYEDIRVIHFHICNLRRKIEPVPSESHRILSVPGVGYRFRLYGE